MDGVQSFGEKRAFGEQIGRLCLSVVQSSNAKSLLFQGLIAREFIQRILGLVSNLADQVGFELAVRF